MHTTPLRLTAPALASTVWKALKVLGTAPPFLASRCWWSYSVWLQCVVTRTPVDPAIATISASRFTASECVAGAFRDRRHCFCSWHYGQRQQHRAVPLSHGSVSASNASATTPCDAMNAGSTSAGLPRSTISWELASRSEASRHRRLCSRNWTRLAETRSGTRNLATTPMRSIRWHLSQFRLERVLK